MTSYARGDVAVVKDGDRVTILMVVGTDTARDLRSTVATMIETVGDSLPEDRRHPFEDMHATLNLALGEVSRRPRPRRERTYPGLPSEV